ncbi:MAG: basic amino acid ABC transporter substrate-binding protein [Armatimonadetes bacterium]|nr:basic amino acid ABC transporter substrate-binding protein [Armatimonadota bacterium]
MSKRLWVLLSILLIVVCGVAACQRRQAQQTLETQVGDLGGREIKIGSDTTYPPFEFVDEQKNIIGFDPDLIAEICKLANCKPKFTTAAWDGIFVALSQGQFDAVVSGVTITEERKKTVDFTDSYLRYGQVVLVRSDETAITGLDTLTGKTVGVQTGTTNDEKATSLQKEGKVGTVKRYDTFDVAVTALINKDLDAVIIDSPAADGFIATNPGKLQKAGETFTSEDLGVAVKKGDTALINSFNAALKVLKDNGTLDRLYKKWFEEFKPGQK